MKNRKKDDIKQSDNPTAAAEKKSAEQKDDKKKRSTPTAEAQDAKPSAKKGEEKSKDQVENTEKAVRKPRSADPETLLWFSVLSGVVAIILYLILSTVTQIPDLNIGIFVAVLYGIAVTFVLVRARHTLRQYTEMQELIRSDSAIMTTLLNISDIPAVLTHDDGTVLWYNNALQDILNVKGFPIFNTNLNLYCPLDIEAIQKATQEPSELDRLAIAASGNAGLIPHTAVGSIFACSPRMANGKGGIEYIIEDRRFLVKSYSALFTANGEARNYNLTVFEEMTELMTLKDKLESEDLVVAYIVLDNLEDLARYARVDYRIAANNIEVHLKEWASAIGGVLCEYDRDKYMLLLSHEKLEECVSAKFPILDKIRAEKLGDGTMSITVSMGISAMGLSLAARQDNAQAALENALRRGGDQVVIKSEKGLECLGGRSKTIQKSENVTARVNSQKISQYARSHSRILIMGHKNPDCDSIGACIGMARFVRSVTTPDTSVRIVINTASQTFLTCTAALRGLPDYKNVFIDANAALDNIHSDTLLIVVDANNFNIVESPDIARSLKDIIVVDHHRKIDSLPESVKLSYVEPSASSACELVSEMLESTVSSRNLYKEEADIILSGILLDTKQFTRDTGTRTFGAAQYLRGAGADPTDVYNLFKTSSEDLSKEARFHTSIFMYRDRIALSSCEGETDESYRVIASKAADKMLTLRNVDAAFALVKIGDQVHISGRSQGKINVQLVLERLGGGGHFDVAGAQITSDSVVKVLEDLKESIDNYLDL